MCGASVWGICAISGRRIIQMEINRDHSEGNIIIIVYSRSIISMGKYNIEVFYMIAFVTDGILIFQGGYNMNKDKKFVVTVIIINMSTMITRVEEIRSIVKGVGKVLDVCIMGF